MRTRHKKNRPTFRKRESVFTRLLFPKVCVHNGWKTKAVHLSVNNFQRYSF